LATYLFNRIFPGSEVEAFEPEAGLGRYGFRFEGSYEPDLVESGDLLLKVSDLEESEDREPGPLELDVLEDGPLESGALKSDPLEPVPLDGRFSEASRSGAEERRGRSDDPLEDLEVEPLEVVPLESENLLPVPLEPVLLDDR
jgi:hypothetical protein